MNQRAQELSSLAVTHANCDLPASRQDRQHLRTCATERGVWQADVWWDQKQLRIAWEDLRIGDIKGRRVAGRHAQEGRQRCKKEKGKKRREESLSIGEESKFKGKRDLKAVARDTLRSRREQKRGKEAREIVWQQQVTERPKSRFELIFVEEVNMIVQSTLFRHSGSCGGAGQVTGGLCVTWPSHQGPEKREYPDAPD